MCSAAENIESEAPLQQVSCIGCNGHQKSGEEPEPRRNCKKSNCKKCTFVLAFVVLVLVIAVIVLAVHRERLLSDDPGPPAGPACQDGWVGYRGKCYYFSETEGNWTYSQSLPSAPPWLGSTVSGKWCSCCAIRVSMTTGSASGGSRDSPGNGPMALNSTTRFR